MIKTQQWQRTTKKYWYFINKFKNNSREDKLLTRARVTCAESTLSTPLSGAEINSWWR